MAATSLDVKLEIADLRNGDMGTQRVARARRRRQDVEDRNARPSRSRQAVLPKATWCLQRLATARSSRSTWSARPACEHRVRRRRDPEQIPPVGLSASLRSRGSSPRALAAGASGRVLFTQGGGRIDNSVMDMASGGILAQLFGALNPMAKEEPFTQWDFTVVRLNVENGLGELSPMLGQAEKLTIVGAGKIDLRSEELDIEFNTKPRTGVGLTADMFVTPFVKVSGTLAQPGIGLNTTGTLLAGGAAVLTGGVSLLAKGMADRVMAEGDQCVEALAEAGYSAQKPDYSIDVAWGNNPHVRFMVEAKDENDRVVITRVIRCALCWIVSTRSASSVASALELSTVADMLALERVAQVVPQDSDERFPQCGLGGEESGPRSTCERRVPRRVANAQG